MAYAWAAELSESVHSWVPLTDCRWGGVKEACQGVMLMALTRASERLKLLVTLVKGGYGLVSACVPTPGRLVGLEVAMRVEGLAWR